MRRLLLAILLVAIALPARGEEPEVVDSPEDAGQEKKYGFILIPPSGYWYDWVFLLQGFYSGLDGLGVGAEVSRPFQLPLLTRSTDVELLFKGRLYEDYHGVFEATVDASIGELAWSVRGHFLHSTRLREFWGVGPDANSENREEYRPGNNRIYVELLRNISRLRLGLRLELHDYQYLEMAPDGLLEGGDYTGVSSAGETIAGGGLTWDFDTRDDRYVPRSGWRVRGSTMFFDIFKEGESGFASSNLDVRNYRALGSKNVLAFQGFVYSVGGDAPIWRYAVIGGREHTRGYSRNRYMDKRMVAVQVEWRRHLYRRLGMQVFTGSALVAHDWHVMQIKYQRPTIGAGLSLVIPQVSNLAIRGDLALGDESVHGLIAIGLAF